MGRELLVVLSFATVLFIALSLQEREWLLTVVYLKGHIDTVRGPLSYAYLSDYDEELMEYLPTTDKKLGFCCASGRLPLSLGFSLGFTLSALLLSSILCITTSIFAFTTPSSLLLPRVNAGLGILVGLLLATSALLFPLFGIPYYDEFYNGIPEMKPKMNSYINVRLSRGYFMFLPSILTSFGVVAVALFGGEKKEEGNAEGQVDDLTTAICKDDIGKVQSMDYSAQGETKTDVNKNSKDAANANESKVATDTKSKESKVSAEANSKAVCDAKTGSKTKTA